MNLLSISWQARIFTVCLMLLGLLGAANTVGGQELQIKSPSSNALYSPGSTINVVVSLTSGQVMAVMVGAPEVGFTEYQTTAPYSFLLTVPANTIGPRNLFAVGLVGTEAIVLSPPVTIDIEPDLQPTGIELQQSLITFAYQGQQRKAGVTALFSDGSTLDISRSSRLIFSTDSPNTVSVDKTGLMTGNGSGEAHITVTYGDKSSTLSAIGPAGISGDLNGDGIVDTQDLFLLESMLGMNLTQPNDARDLNKDGKIDELDVRALLILCGPSCPALIPTSVKLISSANQIQLQQSLNLTANVAGAGTLKPGGRVNFMVDGHLGDFAGLNGANQASISLNYLPVGNHVIAAIYSGDSINAPSTSQPLTVKVGNLAGAPGDVNGDGLINCTDLEIIKSSFGKKIGQPGFDPRADINGDGIVNVLDLSFVARQLPAGTVCQ